MEKIRVMLVDNEEVFREGLSKLLQDQPHIDVVYQCETGKEAIAKSTKTKPNVILINGQISENDTLEAVKEIREKLPDVKIALITRPEAPSNPINILKAGAMACLTKNISANDLVKSIELISSGRIIISPQFAQDFLNDIMAVETSDDNQDVEAKSILSQREIEIVILIAEGFTNKEIAEKLFIAGNTVKVHVKNILNKLELRNRQQLAAYAVLQNWVAARGEEKKN